jgi:hypothetical protein
MNAPPGIARRPESSHTTESPALGRSTTPRPDDRAPRRHRHFFLHAHVPTRHIALAIGLPRDHGNVRAIAARGERRR